MADDTRSAPSVVLIIPTLDEADSIGRLIAEVPTGIADRIIVADSGSTDGTPDVARRHGATVLAVGRGYGRACLTAAQAAPETSILVFMDGDGADDPIRLPAFVGPIADGRQDFVIGSRTRGVAARGSMGPHQRLAGRAVGAAIGLLTGVRYTDMCAFRAIRRETLLRLGMRELTYGWNLEMQMRAAKAGLRVLELPVDNRPRLGGRSKVAGSIRGSLRAATRITTTFLRLALVRAPELSSIEVA